MKSIKTIVACSAAVILGFALVASAVSYTFTSYMSVGSIGADVSALQTWLIANGFSIPSITSGAASTGYYGSQTQAAVRAYQTSVGIPSLGMVGPLTLASLNRGQTSGNTGTISLACPLGFTCTPNVAVQAVCPLGYTCSQNTTGTTIGGQTGITTLGVPGLMSVTAGPLSSSVLNVGSQMAPVLAIRVQAQYSDLDVQSLTLDLGNNTSVYNKLFNSISVTDG